MMSDGNKKEVQLNLSHSEARALLRLLLATQGTRFLTNDLHAADVASLRKSAIETADALKMAGIHAAPLVAKSEKGNGPRS